MWHKHQFVTVFASRWGKVQQCLICEQYQTTMRDLSTSKIAILPGNFLADSLEHKIYVVCGVDEFTKAFHVLVSSMNNILPENIVHLTRMDQIKEAFVPVVFLFGAWYDNDICQSPAFTKILNGWL